MSQKDPGTAAKTQTVFFQFHEAWRKLTDWLEEAEKRLDSELEISNEPDKIKVQLAKHKVPWAGFTHAGAETVP